MIGNVLKMIRICKDMSVKETATMMNTSSSWISDVESRRKNPSLHTLNKFADVYDIEISKILFFDELQNSGKNRNEVLKEILEYYIEKEKSIN